MWKSVPGKPVGCGRAFGSSPWDVSERQRAVKRKQDGVLRVQDGHGEAHFAQEQARRFGSGASHGAGFASLNVCP